MFGRSLNKYTSNERKPVQFFPWVDKKIPSLHLAHKWNSFFLKHQFWCVHEWSHAWSLVSDDLFWSLKAVLLKEAKRLYFFVTLEFFVSITFATELVHRSKKKKWGVNSLLLWKTNLKMTVERRQNHLLIFQKTFRTLPQKWVEAQNEIGRNSFRNDCLLSLRQSKEFSFLLLIGDCKFFFVCGRNVSLFISFFHLKNTSDCIVASQLNENKSNNETNFVWVKN